VINLKIKSKKFFLNFFFIFSIFLIDRISKAYIINSTKENFDINIYTSKFLNLTLIWNEGIAFGLLSNSNDFFYKVLTALIILISIVVLFFSIRYQGLKRYALFCIFGGSLGNLYDRIFFSAVPDFIDFHYNGFHWFIFNVADIFITVGVIIMIMTEFFVKDKNQND
tara:strand:- start:595 stop:1095 length:501 start_codon:yes stop_codon:yes gene_type:complete